MTKERFIPKEGQTDFSNLRYAPVVDCVVQHGDKILLLKRSKNLRYYPGLWSGVAGFLDDEKTVKEKAKEELKEEAGIEERDIISIKEGKIFEEEAPEYGKVWIKHPVLVGVRTDNVKLDWEAEEYIWVTVEEARSRDLVPHYRPLLNMFFGD